MFTPKQFTLTIKKKIIQIGAWMRNLNGINKLNVNNSSLFLDKYVLVGKKMDSYYVIDENNNDIDNLSDSINDNHINDNHINNNDINVNHINDNNINNNNINDNNINNNDINDNNINDNNVNNSDINDNDINDNDINDNNINDNDINDSDIFISTCSNISLSRDNISRKIHIYKNVHIIKHLENNEYDKLLSENLVFLNLIDASAVNTVLECIVRNTPIYVNRLPALEEILGNKYPLFYNNIDEVSDMLTFDYIEKAYYYLKNLDKNKFKIDYFIKKFKETLKDVDINICNKLSNKIGQ